MICLQRVNTKSDARAVILQCLCEYDLVDHDIVPVMSRVFDSSVFTNEATLFSKLIIEKIQENKIFIESISNLNLRVKKFKKFIKNRNEKRIAVIGHGTFYSKIIGYLLNNCEYKIIKNN